MLQMDTRPRQPQAGAKRKRAGDKKFYAVHTGHTPGIYENWKDCLDQVRGFKMAKFKSFETREEAQMYIDGHDPSLDPTSTAYVPKYYGVHRGKVPGVYRDWDSARKQVVGVERPSVRSFATEEEARAFVLSGPGDKPKSSPRSSPTELPSPPRPLSHPLPPREHSPPVKKQRAEPTSQQIRRSRSRSPVGRVMIPPTRTPSPGRNAKSYPILKIYTDGSALGNGKFGASAGVGVWFGENDDRNISEPLQGDRQTNQRAELTAIIRALSIAPLHREVEIYTDSKYSINCVTVWAKNWIRNNWWTSGGKAVENRDLIEEILKRLKEREEYGSRTGFKWVKGHTGVRDGNSMADQLALQGARMRR